MSALKDRLIAQIRLSGPMTVAQYMAACLHDPAHGYYATRPALGAGGDFITAPLVSQMFGELLGLWAVETWMRLGSPPRLRLIEMGPGDGTLMSDVLRASGLSPDFRAAAEPWLVETSAPLRKIQGQKLGAAVRWATALDEVPGGAPVLLIANELLDCLPARQFVRTASGWAERQVGLDDDGGLTFGLTGTPIERALPQAPEGAVLEVSPAQEALGRQIGERLAKDGGAALLIDYGREAAGFGDTLQAVSQHRKVSPLDRPGEADLTVHVDFPAVAEAARTAGITAAPLLTQGEFLARLGIGARAASLVRSHPERADQIGRQLHRLTDPEEMGTLFKVLCLHEPGLVPPGFEP